MRRPVFRRTTTGLALFPFLAVLICTMGSLIVLLVLILQQTRANAGVAAEAEQAAAAEAKGQSDAEAQQRRQLIEDAQWRAQTLDAQRRKQTEDLAQGRLELSHLEDHIRRVQDQAKELVDQLKQSATEKSDAEREKMTADLARQTAEIETARKKLEEAQAAAAKKNKSFTIIPYEGRQGTRRRPIYIECAEEGIILHPENIVFQPSDFNGPLGPGNPLDAALRTVREYLARYGNPAQTGEPYPLLIVRPNGAVAYSMARAAMKSWDDEFGYELVDGEMNLQFPPSDPQLEELLLRTIKDARHRQTVLAAAMPSRYKAAPPPTEETIPTQSFAAAPSSSTATKGQGGFGVGGRGTGRGGGTETGAGFGSGKTGDANGSGTAGRLPGLASNISGNGTNTGKGTGTGGGTGDGYGSGSGPGGTPNSSTSGYASQASLASGRAAAGGTSAQGTGGTGGPNRNGGAAGSGGQGGTDGGASGAAGGPGGSSGGPGGSGGAGGGGGGTPVPGMMAQGGSAQPSIGGAAPTGAAASSTSTSGGSTSGGSSGTSGARGANSRSGSGGKFTMNDASKGKEGEWALPDKPQRATAITRPIRVRCEPHRLLVMPERGDSKRPKVVLVPGEMNESLDEFVSVVRKQMDDWGLAVAGGYWKPVLNVTVVPGGEAQFAELETLLRGSGFEVVRK